MVQTDGGVAGRDAALVGQVFNIQRYSIHDGPGIRTTVFLKGCPLQCAWCQNPESQSAKPEIFFDKGKCTGCGACVKACATGASSLLAGKAQINRELCKACGKCIEACPNQARTLVGKPMTVDQVMEVVLRDRRFYRNSGGGVTLSGGDPIAQIDFSRALLERCKQEGLHTAIETCGCAAWPVMEKILAFTDLVLLDIKCLDAEQHRAGTQRTNELILENARRIANKWPMRIHIPLVPGFNDSPEQIGAIVRFIRTELGHIPIDLMPYNKLGEVKYERLDRTRIRRDVQAEEYLQKLLDIVAKEMGDSGSANN